MRGTRLPFEPASILKRIQQPDCCQRCPQAVRPALACAYGRGPISDLVPDTANRRLPTVELVLCLSTSQIIPTMAQEGGDKGCLPLDGGYFNTLITPNSLVE